MSAGENINSFSKLLSNLSKYLLWIITAFIMHEQLLIDCKVSSLKNPATKWWILSSGVCAGFSQLFASIVKLRENGKKPIEQWNCSTATLDSFSDILDIVGLCLQISIVVICNQNNKSEESTNHTIQIVTVSVAIGFKIIQKVTKCVGLCRQQSQPNYNRLR